MFNDPEEIPERPSNHWRRRGGILNPNAPMNLEIEEDDSSSSSSSSMRSSEIQHSNVND